jgi:hypothetical protein
MVRATNLLLALFIALAPGLSVSRLLHSLELCVYSPAPVTAQAACGHDHGDRPEPERHDPDDCPHLQGVLQVPGAMNISVPVPFDLPPPPMATGVGGRIAPASRVFVAAVPDRPPTGPPAGFAILRI